MTSTASGEIVSIQLCLGVKEPMKTVSNARVIAGSGIEGDRHATSEGPRKLRQVLIMDTETLELLDLKVGDVRENVTTAGLDLSTLEPGHRVSLGADVVLEITGLCDPCGRMEEIRPGLREELEGRRGQLAVVVQGGEINVGDPVGALESASAD